MSDRRLVYRKVLISLALCAVILFVFWQVQTFKLVRYDDHFYVVQNGRVISGLTAENVLWAFTNTEAGFWHPLTWLSLMLDYEVHGFRPGGYHWTNVLFHLASALLLFLVLDRMTGALWKSAFVAALFALHPLQVEPVAWVSQRKDMLSAFFMMLTLFAYVRHAEKPGIIRYLSVVFFYALGLMSKPMIVTLPFAMLLLDYWPLRRFSTAQDVGAERTDGGSPIERRFTVLPLRRLLYEKLPLIFLAVLASLLVFEAERNMGALSSFAALPLADRIANALVSYVLYLWKMIRPSGLAFFYPHPMTTPLWKSIASFFTLAAITVLVLTGRKRRPYLLTGWFWYLGTLLPVIGLIQVGLHGMADRYVYIPIIGLALMIAWGFPDMAGPFRVRRLFVAISAVLVLATFSGTTWFQLGTWRDSKSLFRHALRVTENNFMAHNNLGLTYFSEGRLNEAIREYRTALTIHPNHAFIYNNLAVALIHAGRYDEAVSLLRQTISWNLDDGKIHRNLGSALFYLGRYAEAAAHYEKATSLGPAKADLYDSLGVALLRLHRYIEAENAFRKAMQIDPQYEAAKKHLGDIKGIKGGR